MFRLPRDMKFFRETTTGKVVVMGSNTLASFPGGKPLPARTNIVLFPGGEKRGDCQVVGSLDGLFAEIAKYPPDDVFVIGGAMLYRTLLPYCTGVMLTKVDADGGAEVFFPNLDADENWELAEESEPIYDNGYTIRFTVYKNKDVKKA